MKQWYRPAACLSALGMALALAACGGGGGGSNLETALTSKPANARNGNYQMYATDGRVYTLNLDFDSGAYRITGNGLDATGDISQRNATKGEYAFAASTATVDPGAPRFHTVDADALVGSFRLPSGTLPFVAARKFVTSLADAAGTYNFLTRDLIPAGTNTNSIFNGELQAGGTLRVCTDNGIYPIATCPTVGSYPVTLQGDEFRADSGTGVFPFRVARIGSAKVFLRASPSSATNSRFWVGLPDGSPFSTASDFEGQNTNGQWTVDLTVSTTTYSANWKSGAANVVRSGNANATVLPGLVGIVTPDVGNFFAIRTDELLVVSAARNNPSFPGYFEIAVKR